MSIFFLAAQFVAAQETYVIYEGTQLNYKVDFNAGNTYAWEVEQGSNTVEYEFITDPGLSDVVILWNMEGLYYLTVNESDPDGCSNKKALAVQVQPNNRTFDFDITASTECFNKTDNGFELPFAINDNSGNALAAVYFPMTVEYTINGIIHSTLVQHNNQVLTIEEIDLTLDPTLNTDYVVAVTQVTDVKNASIPDLSNATHTRTIFALPEIEFTEELRRKYNLNYEAITAYNNSGAGRLLRMEPE